MREQHPFAAILACADSRVPPEIIFDQGFRVICSWYGVAGNILNDAALGSLEYAVEPLGIRYIMVLGHRRCGTVKLSGRFQGGEAPGHIGTLVKAIQPAVAKVKDQPGDALANAVTANVVMVVERLKSSGADPGQAREAGRLDRPRGRL